MFSHLLLERALLRTGRQWYAPYPALIDNVVIDSRIAKPGDLFIAFKGERVDGNDFIPELLDRGVWCVGERTDITGAFYVPVSDSLRFLQILAKERVAAKGRCLIVGISGSSGKTTTRELIVAAARKAGLFVHSTQGNLNNHIGLPLTLLAMPERCDMCVCEMGMNHAGELRMLADIASPDIAVLTNIGFAHIGNFSSREDLANAKLELFNGSRSALIRDDDSWMVKWADKAERARKRVYRFRMPEHFDGQAANLPLFMAENAYTAYELLRSLRIPVQYEEVVAIAGKKQLPKYRGEIVEKAGRLFVMDCYNANPDSMRKSIRSFIRNYENADRPLVLVLGEMKELGKFSHYFHQELVNYVKTFKVLHKVFLLGTEFEKEQAELLECQKCQLVHSLAELARLLPQDGIFLLKGSRSNALERLVESEV